MSARLHPRTGYPLLADAEMILAVLAQRPLSCASCFWQKGGRAGAPWADGSSSRDMDPRCDRRYTEMMDLEYERGVLDEHGPIYCHDHRDDGACGSPVGPLNLYPGNATRPARTIQSPLNEDQHHQWWRTNYPYVVVGQWDRPDDPACIHFLARDPEVAKIAAGGRGADMADLWNEFDLAEATECRGARQ